MGVCDSRALKKKKFLMYVSSQQLFSICTFVKDGRQLMYALCLFKADDTECEVAKKIVHLLMVYSEHYFILPPVKK